jgi:hypothetical protein
VKSNTPRAQLHRLERAELILIRAGQHLFKEWRSKGRSDSVLEESFETIWRLKKEVRDAKHVLRPEPRHKPLGGVPRHKEKFAQSVSR